MQNGGVCCKLTDMSKKNKRLNSLKKILAYKAEILIDLRKISAKCMKIREAKEKNTQEIEVENLLGNI